MTQLTQKFSKLSKHAKSLDEQALDFVKQLENLAEEIEKQLNRRIKKYFIEVRTEESFDFSDHRLDFFIVTKDESIHYVLTMSISDDFDEEDLLQECDKIFDEICDETCE